MVHPSPDLHISAHPELVHNQTCCRTPAPNWILSLLHFQRRHPHPRVQAGCGEAWWGQETPTPSPDTAVAAPITLTGF